MIITVCQQIWEVHFDKLLVKEFCIFSVNNSYFFYTLNVSVALMARQKSVLYVNKEQLNTLQLCIVRKVCASFSTDPDHTAIT